MQNGITARIQINQSNIVNFEKYALSRHRSLFRISVGAAWGNLKWAPLDPTGYVTQNLSKLKVERISRKSATFKGFERNLTFDKHRLTST